MQPDHVAAVLALLGVAVLFMMIAVHPFLTYPMSLMVFGRRRRRVAPPPFQALPSVAMCMCAYNEERVIVAKVESLLAMAAHYGPATVHIYVDGASDGTAALLAPYADRVDLIVSAERLGKTAGMNLLVERSDSELIAFTDANVISRSDALAELVAPFADRQVGCTTARLEYSNEAESATSSAGTFYWRIEEALKRIESETVGVIGVDGAFFLVRRNLHQPAPPHLIDDLYVTLSLLMRRCAVVSVDHVIVYERSATRWHEEYRRKRRISCQAFNVHRALWPQLRRMEGLQLYAYVSHRLLKWLLPFFVAIAGACGFGAVVLAVGWKLASLGAGALAALFGIAAVAGWRPAQFPLTVVASLAGVAAGVIDSLLLRRTYTVWKPALSVRS